MCQSEDGKGPVLRLKQSIVKGPVIRKTRIWGRLLQKCSFGHRKDSRELVSGHLKVRNTLWMVIPHFKSSLTKNKNQLLIIIPCCPCYHVYHVYLNHLIWPIGWIYRPLWMWPYTHWDQSRKVSPFVLFYLWITGFSVQYIKFCFRTNFCKVLLRSARPFKVNQGSERFCKYTNTNTDTMYIVYVQC